MAALDGKITIESGLRPCIVHIPALTETVRNMSGKRTVKEIRPAEEYKGLFHLWALRSELWRVTVLWRSSCWTDFSHICPCRIRGWHNPRGRANADTVCG